MTRPRSVIPLHTADQQVDVGVALHEQGFIKEAIAHYRQALRFHPGHPTAAFNLGVALEDLGRLKQAAQAYRKCLTSDPRFADADFNLGCILEKLGDKSGAIRHLARYRQASL